jgi:hypothetical protein
MRWKEILESETLELPDIEVGDTVLVGKFKNRKAKVKGFTKDKNNQPVLKTDKGDQKLFKPRIAKLMTEEAGLLEPTPENIAKAREFAMAKWKERAKERYAPEPADLSYSCKFTSLFAQQLFGGQIEGSWDHQFLKLEDGTVVDLNIDAEDVKALGDRAHAHDPAFFRRNREWRDSMASVKPRVMQWVKEFKGQAITEAELPAADPRFRAYKNPSPKAITKLCQTGDLRGLVVGADIYLWVARYAIHAQGAIALHIPYDTEQRIDASLSPYDDTVAVVGVPDTVNVEQCLRRYFNSDDVTFNTKYGTGLTGRELGDMFKEPVTEDAPDMSGLDMSSYEAFTDSLRRAPKDKLQALNALLMQKREEAQKPLEGLTPLYHGTPRHLAAEIKASGFALTKGQRGGFLGSIRTVQNQGVFLTDSKELANYFGSNRAESGANYDVLRCYVDTSKVLDYARSPVSVRKLGLRLVQEEYGTSTTSLIQAHWWWLLDQPEFVDHLKALGATGIKFPETIEIRKLANAKAAWTYMIFDPSMIKQPHHHGLTIQDFYEWLKGQSAD